MNKLYLLSLLLVTPVISAAPFVVSSPSTQTVTHCTLLLDAAPGVDVPVASDTTGKYCKFDMASLPTGDHTLTAKFVNIDPIWGRSESVTAVPLLFTRPAARLTTAPTGLLLAP
jgi:hypothetical protein